MTRGRAGRVCRRAHRDPYGKALGYEDVFTKLANVRAHYERLGMDPAEADKFVR